MKKYLLIIFFAVLSFAAYAQTTAVRDSFHSWNWNVNSGIWELESKASFMYDANNNRTVDLRQNWNGSSWVNRELYPYTYDANNNNTSWVQKIWDGSSWEDKQYELNTYDVHNNIVTSLMQRWDSTGWVNDRYLILGYDSNNNKTSSIHQEWDSGLWVNSNRNLFTYDSANYVTSQIVEDWDGSNWVNGSQSFTTYSSNYNQSSSVNQVWQANSWVNSSSTVSVYDTLTNTGTGIALRWNGTGWDTSFQSISVYNVNHNLISMILQAWSGSNWNNMIHNIYAYDANNNSTYTVFQNWDSTTWVNTDSFQNYYRAPIGGCSALFNLYPDTNTLHHYYAVNMAGGAGTLNYLWSWGDGTFDSTAYPSHTYASAGFYSICLTISDSLGCTSTHCSNFNLQRNTNSMVYVNVVPELPTGVTQIRNPQPDFRISPNPATTTVTISIDESMVGSTATITDITGRKMAAVSLTTYNLQLSTADFSNGIYFVTVSNGSQSATRKLVVSK